MADAVGAPPPAPSLTDDRGPNPLVGTGAYRRAALALLCRGRAPAPGATAAERLAVRPRPPDVRRVSARTVEAGSHADRRPALLASAKELKVVDGGGRGERNVPEVLKLRGAHTHLKLARRNNDVPSDVKLAREELQCCTEGGDDARVRLGTVSFSVLRPAAASKTRLPALLFIHDEGKSKEEMIPRMEQAARRGYVAVAADLRHHGTRAATPTSYARALEASLRGLPARGPLPPVAPASYLLDSVYDLTHVLDYLCLRGDVDTSRIGALGVGHGGTVAWLLAASDERVAATATVLGAVDFQWLIDARRFGDYVGTVRSTGYLELDLPRSSAQALALGEAVRGWRKSAKGKEAIAAAPRSAGKDGDDLPAAVAERVLDRLAMGLRTHFSAPRAMCAIAPRPLFIAAGELDSKLPVEAVEATEAALDIAYADAPDGTCVVRIYRDVMDTVPVAVDDDVDVWLDAKLLVS